MTRLAEATFVHRAKGTIVHRRPTRFLNDYGTPFARDLIEACAADCGLSFSEYVNRYELRPDPASYATLSTEDVYNVKTNGGIDFTHTQTYGTSPAANGLNYIALSNDTVTETATSTVLSNEIVANGLARAQGTVNHTAATTTTTVQKVFTCATAPQAAQKAALFTAGAGGTMHHVLGFTQRSLQIADQLDLTFTLTIS